MGSEAETKYAKLGTDIHLAINTPFTLINKDQLYWKFNKTVNILKTQKNKKDIEIYDDYKERVVLYLNNSLLLRNVQMNDSGRYTAVHSTRSDKTVSEYNLRVQAPVSPVKMKVASVWVDSVSCNVTVTCSADKTHLNATFECHHDVCKKDEWELPNDPEHLRAFVSNTSIVCQHGNKVSERQEEKEVQQVCSQTGPSNGLSTATWVGISVALVLALLGIGLMVSWIILKRRLTTRQTGIEDFQINDVQNVDANPIYDEASSLPNSIYSLVTHHTGPRQTSCTLVPKPPPEVTAMEDSEQSRNPLLAL
ncbi:SLAM family member 5-like isoform X2 [Corythoichthys intestinalis]|uniref:SLAM family member 5-like isoform X2 n=1 Tax=Corythoichthys intestinalis TaxID=161448 RepID=UPI0025A61D6C|nr:SLAM family member 5-like isoform X2 [Corythoichthys intestinalis]